VPVQKGDPAAQQTANPAQDGKVSAAAAAAAAMANGKPTNNPNPTAVAVVPSLKVQTVPEQVFPFLAEQSPMWKNIDIAKREMASETKMKVEAGTATVASLGASAAYLIWILRGGSLLSSLLSIFPAWKSMDPLPVLESFESERKRRKRRGAAESESLESLVDESNKTGEIAKSQIEGNANHA